MIGKERHTSLIDIKLASPKIARSVLRNSLLVKEGETVTVEAWTNSLPWVDAFLVEARALGANPVVMYDSDEAFWKCLEVDASALGKFGRQERALLGETDAYIYLYGPADRTRFLTLPKRILKTVVAYEDEWFKIVRERRVRVCRLEIARATKKLASEYGVNFDRWVEELYEATLYDPSKLAREGRILAEVLRRGGHLEISHENGTKVELMLKAGSHSLIEDGMVDDQDLNAGFSTITIPSGSVVAPIDENFGEGSFASNRPIRFGTGRKTGKGGRWTFREGRLLKYEYDTGLREFQRDYRDMGAARNHPAMISIGLNPKVRDAPLYEHLEKGVIGLAIGSNEKLGGASMGEHSSWLLLRGADVTLDGREILHAGKILI